MIYTTADLVTRADAINMARSFRHWADAPEPNCYVERPGTIYCHLSRITQLFQRGKVTDVNQAEFNLFCKAVAMQWRGSMDRLRFHDMRNTLSFISTESQQLFYTDIINNGVYFMKPTTSTLPPEIYSKLTMCLAELEQALLTKDPMMPQHLKQSHQLLITYPESVALLDDAEISTLIGAAQIHTGIEVVKATAPKTGGRKKITADEL